jgi:predicted dehydrogenase
LESFVDCVTTGGRPLVSAEDGLKAIETAERIVASMQPQKL